MASTLLVATLLLLQAATAQKFDPYQLNGGLVTAVAGKDYILVASDTRLTDGGYGINTRRYLSGRIWSASSSSSLSAPASTPSGEDGDEEGDTSTAALPWRRHPARWESCGSLAMPSANCIDRPSPPTIEQTAPGSLTSTSQIDDAAHIHSRQATPPIMIGSAGCASDCESLKRRVRLELDALECAAPHGSLGVQSVANLLQQVLYGRRGFPFYSFCVVAGIDEDAREGSGGAGAVYVYDAIGSYERVAVASAGTGRELMQPILDRLFSETSEVAGKRISDAIGMRRDAMAVSAGNQRMGVAGSLRPPVQTTVNCSWQEAVENVARGYRSVAEREISVGDEIVICVVKASEERGGGPVVDVFSCPLKKH